MDANPGLELDTHRLTAMLGQIDALSASLPSKDPFSTLLKGLREFGNEMFGVFYSGYTSGSLKPNIPKPPEYVLNSILDRMADDLDIIQAAFLQRNNVRLVPTLEFADKVGQKAMQFARTAGILADGEEFRVMSFFRQSHNIRITPYANVILIGIPYTCLLDESGEISLPEDYLAISHEVGHFLYWKTSVQKKMLAILPRKNKKQVQASQNIVDWGEEIFADIFGLLADGMYFALGFQDLFLRRGTDADLKKNDGEHPYPVKRPQIYQFTLKALGFMAQAEALEMNWNEEVRKRLQDVPTFNDYDETGVDTFVKDILFDVIKNRGSQGPTLKFPTNITGINEDTKVELAKPFTESIRELKLSSDRSNDVKIELISFDDFFQKYRLEFNTSQPLTSLEQIPPNIDGTLTDKQLDWILLADGWETDGGGPLSRRAF